MSGRHGGHGRRGWRKLHLGVNRSGVIVAQALTRTTETGSRDAPRSAVATSPWARLAAPGTAPPTAEIA